MSKSCLYIRNKASGNQIKIRRSSCKKIQETLNIKSESQVYFWWYWFEYRLTQPQGNNIHRVMVKVQHQKKL